MIKKIKNYYKSLPIQFKCTISYILASLLTNGLSFLTTPLFTRIMTTADMGAVTAFNSWQAILAAIVTLSLSSGSFSVAMVEYKNQRNQYISSILSLSVLSTILFFVIYLLFRSKWNILFNLESNLMILMFAGFLLTPAMNFWLLRERFEYKYKSVLLVTVLSAFLSTSISILSVLYVKEQGKINLGEARLYGSYIPTYVLSGILCVVIIIKGKTFFNKEYWKFALTLSLPLIVHTVSKYILDMSDRIMIDHFIGKSELGIYGVLYTVSSLSTIFWSAINSSIIPTTFEKLEAKKFDDLSNLLKPIICIFAVGCAVLSLFSPEIVKIIATEEYYSAIYLMPPISAGIFFTSIYTIYGNVLTFYKKTTAIMMSTLLAAAINVILNYIFIPKYGAIAASYTTLIAYIFLTIFQMIAVIKVSKESIIEKRFLGIMIAFTIIWSMLCNILYQILYLRMICILVIGFVCIIKRKKIINNLQIIIRKR